MTSGLFTRLITRWIPAAAGNPLVLATIRAGQVHRIRVLSAGRWRQVPLPVADFSMLTPDRVFPRPPVPASWLITDGEPIGTLPSGWVAVLSLRELVTRWLHHSLSDEQPVLAVSTCNRLWVGHRSPDQDEPVLTETTLDLAGDQPTQADLLNRLRDQRILDWWEQETGTDIPVVSCLHGEPVHPAFLPPWTDWIRLLRTTPAWRHWVCYRLLLGFWMGPGILTLILLLWNLTIQQSLTARLDELTDWQVHNRERILAFDARAARQEQSRRMEDLLGAGIPLQHWLALHHGLSDELRLQTVSLDRLKPSESRIVGYCLHEAALTRYVSAVSMQLPVTVRSFGPVNRFHAADVAAAGAFPFRFELELVP